MSTRGGITNPGCFDAAKQAPGHVYFPSDCGRYSAPIEFIAQSRFIYRLNNDPSLLGAIHPTAQGASSGTSISPDIQYETRYIAEVTRKDPSGREYTKTEGQRPDVVIYDASEPQDEPSPVRIIELKVQCKYRVRSECDTETAAKIRRNAAEQVRRYTETFPREGESRVVLGADVPAYEDSYVLRTSCRGGTFRNRTFEVETPSQDVALGVLEIYLVEDTGCPDDDPDQETAPGEDEIEDPVVVDEPDIVDDPDLGPPCAGIDAENYQLLLTGVANHLIKSGVVVSQVAQILKPRPKGNPLPTQQAALLSNYVSLLIQGTELGDVAIAAMASDCPLGRTLAAVSGDPHIYTLDGLAYDLQTAGEFHLVSALEHGFDIQARFVPVNSRVSVTDRIAFDLNGFRTEITRDGKLYVDGDKITLVNGGMAYMNAGAFAWRLNDQIVVFWPGLDADRPILMVRGSTFKISLPSSWETEGLLGNNNGTRVDDLRLKNGTTLPEDAEPEVLHGPFADSWSIDQTDSLFSYGPGETTGSFTDPSFPAQFNANIDDYTEAEVAAATEICADAGVEPGPQFDGCVLDLLLTGDAQYAEGAALVTGNVVASDSAGFDGSGHLGVDFEASVPSNFAAVRYSGEPATTRLAGPLFDDTGYRFSVGDVARHDSFQLAADLYVFGPVASDSHDQMIDLQINGAPSGRILLDDEPMITNLPEATTASLTETGRGVAAGGHAYVRFHLNMELPPARYDAVSMVLQATGFRGIYGTSFGVDNIDMAIDTPAAQVFPISNPATVPSAQATQADGAGRLESPGAADLYRFNVGAEAAGAKHAITTSGCGTALTINLTKLDGTQIDQWRQRCGRVDTSPLASGAYELSVSGINNSGPATYGLDILPVPDPQRFDYTLRTPVARGDLGEGSARLETIASTDIYEFNLSGGTLVYDAQSCVEDQQWELRRSGEVVVRARGDSCNNASIPGLADGDYEWVTYTNGNKFGAYSFMLFTPTDLTHTTAADLTLTVGDPRAPAGGVGNLETIQSTDRYTFSVEPEDEGFMVGTIDCPDGNTHWAVYDDNDIELATGNCIDLDLSAAGPGDYRLDVTSDNTSSSDQGIGPYSFQIWATPLDAEVFPTSLDLNVSPGHVNSDPVPGAGTLETKASVDEYTFNVPDDATELDVTAATCSRDGALKWTLRDTNDITIADGSCESGHVNVIATEGDYTLSVTAIGRPVSYDLTVSATTPGTPMIIHSPVLTTEYQTPVVVDAVTSCSTGPCQATLFYRTTELDTSSVNLPNNPWTSIAMTANGTLPPQEGIPARAWQAVIPGTAANITGIDYYIEADDATDTNQFPADPPAIAGGVNESTGGAAPVASQPYWHIATLSPPLLVHVTPGFAPADRDISLTVQATCSTGDCSGSLYYRDSAGVTNGAVDLQGAGVKVQIGADGWTQLPLKEQNDPLGIGGIGDVHTYEATIPGADVDTVGIDYFFQVTDGEVETYWPGTPYNGYYIPMDGLRLGYHTLHVTEPPHIQHVPVVRSNYREPIKIEALSNCPEQRTCTARLYYRTTPEDGTVLDDLETFDDVDMQVNEATVPLELILSGNRQISISATIPAAIATTDGVDYFFRVDDGTTTTWAPGTGQQQGYVPIEGVRVGYHHTHISEPPLIVPTTTPIATAGEPLLVEAMGTCVTGTCNMTLHWAPLDANGLIGSATWKTMPMSPTSSLPTGELPLVNELIGTSTLYNAEIPGADVTEPGIVYRLESNDGHVTSHAPGTRYSGAWFTVDGIPISAFPVIVSEAP